METERSLGINRQQHLWIAAAIWILMGTGLLTMGSIFWFHFPYLGFVVGLASPVIYHSPYPSHRPQSLSPSPIS